MTPDTAAAHCAGLVRDAARPRFIAALFAPEPVRRRLMAFHALDAELRTIREKAHEPMIQAMRFQWWRDVIAALPETRGHPVLIELALIDDAGVAADLIDAHEADGAVDVIAIAGAAQICGGASGRNAVAEAAGAAIAAGDRAALAEARSLWRAVSRARRIELPAYLPATVVDMRHPVGLLRLQWRMLRMGLSGRF